VLARNGFEGNDNPTAADKLEDDIYAACELLAKNPRLGHRRSDLTDEPVLFWPVRAQYIGDLIAQL
jgi:plasmid stabilization system protein ParE